MSVVLLWLFPSVRLGAAAAEEERSISAAEGRRRGRLHHGPQESPVSDSRHAGAAQTGAAAALGALGVRPDGAVRRRGAARETAAGGSQSVLRLGASSRRGAGDGRGRMEAGENAEPEDLMKHTHTLSLTPVFLCFSHSVTVLRKALDKPVLKSHGNIMVLLHMPWY